MNTFSAGVALAPHLGYIPTFSAKRTFAKYRKNLSGTNTIKPPPFLYFPGASVRERPAGGRIEKGGGRKAGGASFPPRGLRERETERSEETVFFREVIQSSASSSAAVLYRGGLSPAADSPTDRATMEKGILSLYLPSFFFGNLFSSPRLLFCTQSERRKRAGPPRPWNKIPLTSSVLFLPLSPFCQRAEGMIRLPPTYLLLQTRGGTRSKFTFVQIRRLLKKGPLL